MLSLNLKVLSHYYFNYFFYSFFFFLFFKCSNYKNVVVAQSLSLVRLFATPWTAAHQVSLSLNMSWSSPKSISLESVVHFIYLVLCCSLLFLPSLFPSIRVFSSESVLHIRWPSYQSFSFSFSPSNEYSGLISLVV